VNQDSQETPVVPETLEALVTLGPQVTWVHLATLELVLRQEMLAEPHLTHGLARQVFLVRPETLAHLVTLELVLLLVARAELPPYHGRVLLVLLAMLEQLATQDLPALVLHQEMLVEPHLTRGLARPAQQELLETLALQATLGLVQLRPMLQRTVAPDHRVRLVLLETPARLVMQELVQEMVAMVL
jgi:hypothetical protein